MATPEAASWPTVSVIVPVKDTEPELLLRAVCSALHQDYAGEIDVVVFDDGSSEGRYRFNDGWLAALPRPDRRRIRTGRSPINRGISVARNEASRIATGAWLAWLDSDDELPRDAIRLLAGTVCADDRVRLVAGQCAVVFPGGRRVHRNDRFLHAWRQLRGGHHDPALRTVFAVHGSLVHRDLFWNVGGFDPRMTFGELTDWFLRVLAAAQTTQVTVVSETTYVHHKRPASHSSDRTSLERHRRVAMERYARAIGLPFRPGLRLGDRCLESGARRYALLDELGRTLVRASMGFSSLLYTVRHDPLGGTGPEPETPTEALQQITGTAAATGRLTPGPAAHRERGVRRPA